MVGAVVAMIGVVVSVMAILIMSYIGYSRKGAVEPFAWGTGDLRGATPLQVAAFDMNGASRTFGVGESRTSSNAAILRALLEAGADQHLTTDDGTTPFMAAAGLWRSTYTPRQPRRIRSPSAEGGGAGAAGGRRNIDAVNEVDFTLLTKPPRSAV